ncbi:hypothetical protein [Maricaulis sp.]|uniref:hypothetical protein n=1 Tax=Maricaulis sp. TaxID=1486257 RepID=UPI00329A38E4
MSLRNCIERAVREGELDRRQADEMLGVLEQERAAGASEFEADSRAMARLEAEAAEAARRTRLQVAASRRIREQVLARQDTQGRRAPGDALPELIEHFGSSPHSSVRSRYNALRGRAHGLMTDAVFEFERDALSNTRNRARLENLVREALGEDSGDAAARDLAQGWLRAADFLRQRYNAAGGAIARLDGWGLPQVHDSVRIAREGFEAWRAYIRPRLDEARMIDHATGEPLAPGRIDELLEDTYRAITTHGWSRREPSSGGGARSLARRRGEHRFLVFRDADSWMEYQTRFGEADPFSAMMNHIDTLARDTASMEILGPNPNATLRFAEQVALKEAEEGRADHGGFAGRSPVDAVKHQAAVMRDMWDLHTGAAYASSNTMLGRVVGDAVNFKISTQLGSAAISALTDDGFHRLARGMQGMNEHKLTGQLLRMFNPASDTDRRMAVRAGLIADGAAQVMGGQGRFINEFSSHEVTRRLPDIVLRWSGLSPMTEGRRWAFGMEMMGWLGDQAERGFDDLPKALRESFQRHGISPADWDVIRSVDLYEPQSGARFLRPEDVGRSDRLDPADADRLATRLLEMVQIETEYAVPTASLRARAFLGAASSTSSPLVNIFRRSFAMYKSFPVSVLMLYSGRTWQVAAQAGVLMGARLAAKMLIYTTVLGALSLQVKEIVKGRDPRPMNTPEFWMSAGLQGGGMGIFGDFLFSDVNRFGGGLAMTAAGPLVQTADEVRNLTIGNVAQALQGEDTDIGAEATRFLRGNTPGGSIWYLRLAYERMLLDSLQEEIDPQAGERFRRLERRYRRDYGQGYWWAPGEQAPDRAPDLANAGG